ncbi:hypothetical protein [Bhargavaea cecembensis]|uniref:hypothetical protein n=1 Tax=Bhargavaea cecembensis TaxID=394098 RepID=UPI00058F4A9A|nr:hypothetical protein [Bhargavaea cecembensis]
MRKPEWLFLFLVIVVGIGALFKPFLLRYLFLVLAASFAYRLIRPLPGKERHRWLNLIGVGIGLLAFILIQPE